MFHEPPHLHPIVEIFGEDEIHLWQWKSSSTDSVLLPSIFQYLHHIYHICYECIFHNYTEKYIVKLGSRSKVYLKSLIRDLDLELVAIIAMSPTTTHHHPLNFSGSNNSFISS